MFNTQLCAKTWWQTEKLLVKSNFSFCHHVFKISLVVNKRVARFRKLYNKAMRQLANFHHAVSCLVAQKYVGMRSVTVEKSQTTLGMFSSFRQKIARFAIVISCSSTLSMIMS